MHEQAVSEDGRLCGVMNSSRDRMFTTIRSCLAYGLGVGWQFAARIYSESNAIKPRMESHLVNPEMKLFTSLYLCNGASRFAGFSKCPSARVRPLRIAKLLGFLYPGS